LIENPEGKNHFANPGVGGRIIRKSILQKEYEEWTGLIWLRRGTSDGLL
jgi:hypothetical protein